MYLEEGIPSSSLHLKNVCICTKFSLILAIVDNLEKEL